MAIHDKNHYSIAFGDKSEQPGLAELRTHAEILANMAEGVIVTDDDGAIFFTNIATQRMYGYSLQELTGMHVSQLRACDAEEARRTVAGNIAVLKGNGYWNGEFEARRKSGETFIAATRISRIVIGGRPCLVGIQQDVTALKKAEENLRLWGRAIEASSNGITIVDATVPEHPIIYANPAFRQITGYTLDEVKGRNPRFLHGDDSNQPELTEIRAAVRQQREGRAILRNYRKNGESFWNDLSIGPVREADGRVTHFIGVLNDITERKRYEAELEYQATHDALTNLPNRTLLQDRLQQTIARAHRDQNMAAVLFIDLDRFKVVNDSIGHDAGDQLLRGVARRLHSIFRAGDTVARQGGDEFVVVVEHIDSEQEATELIQRVLQSMTTPFSLGQQQFYATCSVGVALYPKDGTQAFELLKNADAAMYRAKEEGRNTFRFYTSEMNARALLHFELEAAMRGAIGREEFVLHYQPQVELTTGRLIGFEALIRWQHPQLGLLAPGAFISLAEETAMIVQIGEWVLREACRQAKAWQEQGLGEYFVAVNLSARQFSDCTLVQQVDAALKDAGLEAQYLELELTESLLMENPDAAVEILARLRERGVQLSIDDFGTGYSSLGYLKRFPLDKLKIDHSFVRDIINDPDDAAIATAIIAMAHRLKLKVVAEGVETEEQLAYLGLHRCDEVQGFLFSSPLPAEDCADFLRSKPTFDPPQGKDRRRTLQALR